MTVDEGIKIGAAISIAVTGAIIGWQTALKPFCDARRAKKAAKTLAIEHVLADDKLYRKTVLEKLVTIEDNQGRMGDSIANIQRDSLERSYCMFVIEHGYCPSGMKMAIADMYSEYTANGHNHIAKERMDELMALPEFPIRNRRIGDKPNEVFKQGVRHP